MGALERVTDAAEAKAKRQARIRLFGKMLTTYGYGAMGGGLGKPLLEGQPFTIWNYAALVAAIAMQGLALYLAKGDD